MNISFAKMFIAYFVASNIDRLGENNNIDALGRALTNSVVNLPNQSGFLVNGKLTPEARSLLEEEISANVLYKNSVPKNLRESKVKANPKEVIDALKNLGIKRDDLDNMTPDVKRALYDRSVELGLTKDELKKFSVEDKKELMFAIQQLSAQHKTRESAKPILPSQAKQFVDMAEKVRSLREIIPELSDKNAIQLVKNIDSFARILVGGDCNLKNLLALLDASGSMGIGAKHLLALQAVSQISQGLGAQLLYAVRFSSYAEQVYGPGILNQDAVNAIEGSRYMGGGTAMSTALQKVLEVLPTVMNNPDGRKSLMLTFSDFNVNSIDRPLTDAKFAAIKAQFPELINWCIIIGTDGDINYGNTQCGPDRVLQYPNTDVFYNSISEIIKKVCPIIAPTPVPSMLPTTNAPTIKGSLNPSASPSASPTASPTAASEDKAFFFWLAWARRRKVRRVLTPDEEQQLTAYCGRLEDYKAQQNDYLRAKEAYDTQVAEYNKRLAAFEQQANGPQQPPEKHKPANDKRALTTSQHALKGSGIGFGLQGIMTYDDRRTNTNINGPHDVQLPHPGRPPVEPNPPAPFNEQPPEFELENTEWQLAWNPLSFLSGIYGMTGSSPDHIPKDDPKAGFLKRQFNKLPNGRKTVDGPLTWRARYILGEIKANDFIMARDKAVKAWKEFRKEKPEAMDDQTMTSAPASPLAERERLEAQRRERPQE